MVFLDEFEKGLRLLIEFFEILLVIRRRPQPPPRVQRLPAQPLSEYTGEGGDRHRPAGQRLPQLTGNSEGLPGFASPGAPEDEQWPARLVVIVSQTERTDHRARRARAGAVGSIGRVVVHEIVLGHYEWAAARGARHAPRVLAGEDALLVATGTAGQAGALGAPRRVPFAGREAAVASLRLRDGQVAELALVDAAAPKLRFSPVERTRPGRLVLLAGPGEAPAHSAESSLALEVLPQQAKAPPGLRAIFLFEEGGGEPVHLLHLA